MTRKEALDTAAPSYSETVRAAADDMAGWLALANEAGCLYHREVEKRCPVCNPEGWLDK